jgi:protein arginine kinase activator
MKMLCQDCNKREASVHLTQIRNNEKIVLNLCKICAEKRGFHSPFEQMPFPLAEFVTGMVGPSKGKSQTKSDKGELQEKKCPGCGLTFSEFGRVGRLGCAKCYQAFRPELTDILRKIHGSADHRGKTVGQPSEDLQPIREEKRLREELKRAIESENFEAAARLRDEIRNLSIHQQLEDK